MERINISRNGSLIRWHRASSERTLSKDIIDCLPKTKLLRIDDTSNKKLQFTILWPSERKLEHASKSPTVPHSVHVHKSAYHSMSSRKQAIVPAYSYSDKFCSNVPVGPRIIASCGKPIHNFPSLVQRFGCDWRLRATR